VRHTDGAVVTDVATVIPDEMLRVTVASGDFAVRPIS
jgi:exodeoxyribonuclease VII large subunit